MAELKKQKENYSYESFDQIDGSHPLKSVIPEGYVDYPARIRRSGKVSYFNFELAKELGLIDHEHENEFTKELEKKIYDTFSIQIINEYDIENDKKFKSSDMKSGQYMATRYLQLQHDDKKGLNSGDGRSIWLGNVKHRGKTWDISACGTGATKLSPATSKYNKFFETGDPSISYGCGYAEFDEGVATALMSKIFSSNNIKSEETLCIIKFPNNISINVRVHQNLLRPSHFFLYLKQERLEDLKNIFDYYIEKQIKDKKWKDCPKGTKRFTYFLDTITKEFAEISADFEDDYIFCWLDWDGDNILMDGSIIDYGSIRQFGIFHHEYRYDDVERFSTSILEQKSKAKYIVQSFIQMVDYIKSGEKKSIQSFNSDKYLNEFEKYYETKKNLNLLNKIGFSPKKSKQILKRKLDAVEDFRKVFSYFEKAKSKAGIVKISDGVTCDAVFNMRKLLREYPQVLMAQENIHLSYDSFIDICKSGFALDEDLELNSYRKSKISEFQSLYETLIENVTSIFQEEKETTLMGVILRSNIVNKPNRITGDAITHIVDLVSKKISDIDHSDFLNILDLLQLSQNCIPEQEVEKIEFQKNKKLFYQILDIIRENREGI